MTERLTNIERANLDAETFIANTFPGRELFVADDGGFHLRSAGSPTDWWPPLSAPEVRHAIRVYLGLRGLPAVSRDVARVLRGMRRVLPALADLEVTNAPSII